MQFAEKLISGMLPLCMLMLCGLYLTFKLKFIQFGSFLKSIKQFKSAFSAKRNKNYGISSAQSACTALSATVGTGNIAGVAGAISLGGAGAVFWMIISAVIGMAVKYAEITLAVKYREKVDEDFSGGPMYYIKNGLPAIFKPLATSFAIATIPAVLCTGNITQTNAAVSSLNINPLFRLVFGIIFAFLTFIVIRGGGRSIASVTEKIVPLMSVLYIILTLGIIIFNIDFLPEAVKMIIVGAFTPKAVTAGAVGSVINCIVTGASRGVFSNEAGLGTSGMAHSKAYDADYKTQGLYGIFEVFIDTIVICTLTALTILCSRVNINYGSIASSELVVKALDSVYGELSTFILGFMMCVFAFSSIIGWALYGNICGEYLFGEKHKAVFNIIYPLACISGAVFGADTAWRLSEFFNGVMLCINLPILVLLSDSIKTEKRIEKYERKNKKITGFFRKG